MRAFPIHAFAVVVLAAVAALAAGCASRPAREAAGQTKGGAPGDSAGRAPGASVVDLFCRPDDVPYSYTELSVVTVLGWGRSREEMLRELRWRASQQGAEGVVLFDEQKSASPSLDYSEGSCTLDSVMVRGMAIRRDEDEDRGAEKNDGGPP